jgi:hypothetical protein
MRHGSPQVMHGGLHAVTDTDYLYFVCPGCDAELKGGSGIALEGISDQSRLDPRRPRVLLFRIDCADCGLRDYFKIAIDQSGFYGTGRVRNPLDWVRPNLPTSSCAVAAGEHRDDG